MSFHVNFWCGGSVATSNPTPKSSHYIELTPIPLKSSSNIPSAIIDTLPNAKPLSKSDLPTPTQPESSSSFHYFGGTFY